MKPGDTFLCADGYPTMCLYQAPSGLTHVGICGPGRIICSSGDPADLMQLLVSCDRTRAALSAHGPAAACFLAMMSNPDQWPAILLAYHRPFPSHPVVVTLCGSTKFKTEYEDESRKLGLANFLVISVSLYGHADADISPITPEQKEQLDLLHLRKIDLSDEIRVVSRDGYIGKSTIDEIHYARSTGKRVTWREAAAERAFMKTLER